MKDLTQIREQINKVDDKILQLFLERMSLSKEVAEQKKQSGKLVSDKTRENEIIVRLAKATPEELKLYLKEVYETIFSVSKSYQSTIINSTSVTVEKLKEGLKKDNEKLPFSATVACQGVEGANSGTAAKGMFSACEISYFKNFESVFSAVDKGLCEYGVLPIDNSTAGSVLEVYDLMKKYNFYIIGSKKIMINHCLASVQGATKESIKKVTSHPQALSQCKDYIKLNKLESITAENTAVAAKEVANANDVSLATLCSKECAEIYGLKVIEENVQDNAQNYTKFILISKELKILEGADRISVMTSIPHESGSLSKMLARFSSLGLNLSKIESRPIPQTDFEFLFYLDFNGNIKDNGVLNLISELENSSLKFTFLGTYKEIL